MIFYISVVFKIIYFDYNIQQFLVLLPYYFYLTRFGVSPSLKIIMDSTRVRRADNNTQHSNKLNLR